ncbi:MAG: WD40 repeat domain-containing protein [Desulfurococcales archaeon]|nr:WD40 repeat domain-containing protein [Desulfurococcales archaeon]
MEWSPDGTMLVTGGVRNKVIALDTRGNTLWERELYGIIYDISWSPDGSMIAVVGENFDRVVALDTQGNLVWETKVGEYLYPLDRVSWSPNGKWLAAAESTFQLFLLDREGNLLWKRDISYEFNRAILDFTWSPDGSMLAVSTTLWAVSTLMIFDPNGTIIWKHELDEYTISKPLWSPDGSMLVIITSSGKVLFFSRDGDLLWSYEDPDPKKSIGMVAAWSPDGGMIVASGTRIYGNLYSLPMVMVFSINGTKLTKLWEHVLDNIHMSATDIEWSPDGSMIAVGTYPQVIVYNSSDGKVLWRHDLQGEVMRVAWSPDGSMLAAGSLSGNVALYNITEEIKVDSPTLLDQLTLNPYIQKLTSSDNRLLVSVILLALLLLLLVLLARRSRRKRREHTPG